MIIEKDFYLRDDVVTIARELLGKYLVTNFDGFLTSGFITETEAYAGIVDKASHAYGNRLTKRTEVMYRCGGVAYIYLCYGVHSLFNIVTNREGIPHAVLIRGIQPVDGKQTMLKRTGKKNISNNFGNGPGKVSKILGFHFSHSGIPLTYSNTGNRKTRKSEELKIWLEDRNLIVRDDKIKITSRIGVNYAGDDAKLPYRFVYEIK